MRSFSLFVAGAAVAAGFVAGGCGSGSSSPAVPSSPASLTSPGATIQGSVNAKVGASSVRSQSSGSGLKVTVVGTGLQAVTDGSGRFVLTGVPTGSVTLRFEGPSIDARIDISGLVAGQVLTLAFNVSGSTAEIETEPNDAPSPSPSPKAGKEVEFKGTIETVTVVDAATGTLVVSGRSVMVDSSTKIKNHDKSIGLGDLTMGMVVEVKGTQTGADPILARKITVEDNNEDDDNEDDDNEDEDQEVEFSGTISSISSPTPPASLMVANRPVMVDTNTRIEVKDHNGSLSDLHLNDRVEVKGTLMTDGTTVRATRIKLEH